MLDKGSVQGATGACLAWSINIGMQHRHRVFPNTVDLFVGAAEIAYLHSLEYQHWI